MECQGKGHQTWPQFVLHCSCFMVMDEMSKLQCFPFDFWLALYRWIAQELLAISGDLVGWFCNFCSIRARRMPTTTSCLSSPFVIKCKNWLITWEWESDRLRELIWNILCFGIFSLGGCLEDVGIQISSNFCRRGGGGSWWRVCDILRTFVLLEMLCFDLWCRSSVIEGNLPQYLKCIWILQCRRPPR